MFSPELMVWTFGQCFRSVVTLSSWVREIRTWLACSFKFPTDAKYICVNRYCSKITEFNLAEYQGTQITIKKCVSKSLTHKKTNKKRRMKSENLCYKVLESSKDISRKLAKWCIFFSYIIVTIPSSCFSMVVCENAVLIHAWVSN